MCKFGVSIRYILVDLINLYTRYGAETFEQKKKEYLLGKAETNIGAYSSLSCEKIEKIKDFIVRYVDSLTCENEMKMECFFHQNEPAFIHDKVNLNLFNFEYADKIYQFAQEYGLEMRIHTIVWYRHVPRQLAEYIEERSPEDKRTLTLDFIRTYMTCLKERYPKCYCVDVINEMFDFYSGQGIDIQITEFDVSNHSSKEQQYQIFSDFIAVAKNYPVKAFTMWGLNDELSWLPDDEPLLIDKNYHLKAFARDYIEHFSNKANSYTQ